MPAAEPRRPVEPRADHELAAFAARHAPELLVVVDAAGTIRWTSPASDGLLGLDPETSTGRSMLDYVHPDDVTLAAAALGEAGRSAGHHLPVRVRVRTAADDWLHCEASARTTSGCDAGPWHVLALRPRDGRSAIIERRERIERLIQQSSVRCARARWFEADGVAAEALSGLAEVVGAATVELAWDEDDTGLRTRAAWGPLPGSGPDGADPPPFESLWGPAALARELVCFSSAPQELPATPTRDLLVAAGAGAVVETRLPTDHAIAVLRLTFGDDWHRWDDTNVDLVGLLATGLASTLRRCRAEQALQERARRDPLTGLFNREELYRILEAHVAVAGRGGAALGVLYADLDRFKQVNDELGHAAGDRLLREVATVLRTHTRDRDAVGRVGGDEFVIVCPEVAGEAELRAVADRIAAAVALLAPPGTEVAISLGAALAAAGMGTDELLHAADRDMYRRKVGG